MLGYLYCRLVKTRPDFHSCLIFPFSDLEKLGSVCMAFYTCGITDVILVSSILLFGYRQITSFCTACLWEMTPAQNETSWAGGQQMKEMVWKAMDGKTESGGGKGWTTPVQQGIAREESRMLAVTFCSLQDWFSQSFISLLTLWLLGPLDSTPLKWNSLRLEKIFKIKSNH